MTGLAIQGHLKTHKSLEGVHDVPRDVGDAQARSSSLSSPEVGEGAPEEDPVPCKLDAWLDVCLDVLVRHCAGAERDKMLVVEGQDSDGWNRLLV